MAKMRAVQVSKPNGPLEFSQNTLNFCSLCGVRSQNEIFPLERAVEAMNRA